MATAVEVEQRGLSCGSLGVAPGLGIAEGLDGGVEAVDVCLVVLGVVQLHDLAGDGGLERAVVVWESFVSVFRVSLDCLESLSQCLFRALTGQVGESRLAAGEARGGHGGERLCGAGAEAGAQEGRRAEERGGHCCGCGL